MNSAPSGDLVLGPAPSGELVLGFVPLLKGEGQVILRDHLVGLELDG